MLFTISCFVEGLSTGYNRAPEDLCFEMLPLMASKPILSFKLFAAYVASVWTKGLEHFKLTICLDGSSSGP